MCTNYWRLNMLLIFVRNTRIFWWQLVSILIWINLIVLLPQLWLKYPIRLLIGSIRRWPPTSIPLGCNTIILVNTLSIWDISGTWIYLLKFFPLLLFLFHFILLSSLFLNNPHSINIYIWKSLISGTIDTRKSKFS
jgi:hypothetical protein